jgi:hypothetical protein
VCAERLHDAFPLGVGGAKLERLGDERFWALG